jgi:PTH1 family peptidyl-tRNA hydrolase
VGIGPVPKHIDPAAFVLGRFQSAERTELDATLLRAAEAAEAWATLGIDAAMNRYN